MELMVLLVWLGSAIGAGAIASSKNRSFFGYFVLGAVLPVIGLIIAAGMAPRQVEPNTERRGSSRLVTALVVVGIVGGLVLLGRMIEQPPATPYLPSGSAWTQPAPAQDAHSQTGCSASRRAIEAQLKSPGSAKWVDCNSTTSAGVQTVRLTVDSQNSYGAMMRTQWVTTVRNNIVERVQQVK